MNSFKSRVNLGAALVAAMAFGTCDEFPTESEDIVASGTLNSPTTLAVTDTAIVTARFVDNAGRELTGLALEWEVGDPSLLSISEMPQDTGAVVGRARIVARGVGATSIRARIAQPGFRSTSVAEANVSVTQWDIGSSDIWPDTLTVWQRDTIELEVPNSDSTMATALRVVWTSSDEAIASVERVLPHDTANRQQTFVAKRRAVIVARGSGQATISAAVSRDGFEPSEFQKTIVIRPLILTQALPFVQTLSTLGGESFAVLRVAVRDHRGNDVPSAQIHWQSTGSAASSVNLFQGDSRTTVVQAVNSTLATVTIVAAFDEAGFERAEIRHDIKVTEAWRSISAGYHYTCGTTVGWKVYCWGSGLPDGNSELAPSRLMNTTELRDRQMEHVSVGAWNQTAGSGFVCATARDDVGYCMGTNTRGELGTGNTIHRFTPVEVGAPEKFNQIIASDGFACAVTSSRASAYCWGLNNWGQLGTRSELPLETCAGQPCSLKARRVDFPLAGQTVPLRLSDIAPGGAHTCGIFATGATPAKFLPGRAACWGRLQGILPAPTQSDTAVLVPGDRTWRQIVSGTSHTCGMDTQQHVFCWGSNAYGQLGNPDQVVACATGPCRTTPLEVAGSHTFFSIGAGYNSTCGLSNEAGLVCWGSNEHGIVGTRTDLPICAPSGLPAVRCARIPTQVPMQRFEPFYLFTVGYGHACALNLDGVAYCWGGGSSGIAAGGGSKIGDGVADAGRAPTLPVRVREPIN